MKIAIVHDYLNQFGGAERVVEALHETFPEAPIFTSIYLPERMPESFRKMKIITSFMQKLPFLGKHFKKYLLLYPFAFSSFDLSGYDIILSSSSAFAKGIRKPKGSCHVCYCYSPMRFVWRYADYIKREGFNRLIRMMLPLVLIPMKQWDIKTNKGVDHFIGISDYIAQRIKQCYQRDADVIYPPVEVSKYRISDKIDDYFLIVSRLNSYKRIDIAIKAFNKLGLPLKIIGDGPCMGQLKKTAQNNIKFLGKVPDDQLPEYYSKCRAVIFPGEEDFGIVPVEAQAAGRPVIAYGSGGALETVIRDKTGVFFNEPTEDSLIEAIYRFDKISFNSGIIRENALRFDKAVFKKKIKEYVNACAAKK